MTMKKETIKMMAPSDPEKVIELMQMLREMREGGMATQVHMPSTIQSRMLAGKTAGFSMDEHGHLLEWDGKPINTLDYNELKKALLATFKMFIGHVTEGVERRRNEMTMVVARHACESAEKDFMGRAEKIGFLKGVVVTSLLYLAFQVLGAVVGG